MFNFLKHPANDHSSTLVREIVEQSVAATLRRLSSHAEKMSPAELRGYVRAHALPCVCDERAQLAAIVLPKPQEDRLIAVALEQTTHRVVRQLKSHPVVAMPTPHIRLRLAA